MSLIAEIEVISDKQFNPVGTLRWKQGGYLALMFKRVRRVMRILRSGEHGE